MFKYKSLDGLGVLKLLLVVGLVMMTGILAAANTGDYRTKWGWGNFSDPSIWDKCTDGPNDIWTIANSRPPDGFTGTIYGNHIFKKGYELYS